MTKLEELKATLDAAFAAADAAYYAACRAGRDAAYCGACRAAWAAYDAELKKTKEQTND